MDELSTLGSNKLIDNRVVGTVRRQTHLLEAGKYLAGELNSQMRTVSTLQRIRRLSES